jgi:hypothetical protein
MGARARAGNGIHYPRREPAYAIYRLFQLRVLDCLMSVDVVCGDEIGFSP